MYPLPTRAELFRTPLQTARLVLRPLDVTDSGEFWMAVELSRKDLTPWLPWTPFVVDPESAYRYLEACTTDWDTGRSARFAVRDRAGTFLGVSGIETLAPAHLACEIGYWVRSDAGKHRIAAEATRALLDWTFGRLGANRIRVAACTENTRSLSVIRQLGFAYEGTSRQSEFCDGRYLDHAVFAMLRTDPQARA
jgi:ribosomal-protein-serine acetyltransferase